MHLVAGNGEPPERHGPHPADALLVAAGRLSEIAPAISLQTLCGRMISSEKSATFRDHALWGRMISSEKSATFRDHALAPPPDRMGDHAKIGYCCAAAALAVACFLAYDAIPDLPLAPQSDEPKKANFVLAGLQDFLQPLLLLQTVRLANLIARYTDQLAVVELGR